MERGKLCGTVYGELEIVEILLVKLKVVISILLHSLPCPILTPPAKTNGPTKFVIRSLKELLVNSS